MILYHTYLSSYLPNVTHADERKESSGRKEESLSQEEREGGMELYFIVRLGRYKKRSWDRQTVNSEKGAGPTTAARTRQGGNERKKRERTPISRHFHSWGKSTCVFTSVTEKENLLGATILLGNPMMSSNRGWYVDDTLYHHLSYLL